MELETSAQWICVFQLGNSRAIHIMLEKVCFGLFVCFRFWLPRQIKLSFCDLQMKVAVAEGLMGLKEGRVSHRKIFLEFHLKIQGKHFMSVIVHLLEVAISPVLTLPLVLLNFKPLAQKHLEICHCNSLAIISCLGTQLSSHWAFSALLGCLSIQSSIE